MSARRAEPAPGADAARPADAARQELWALACALGPRPAGQLRLLARLMARPPALGGRPAGSRRWWHFAPDVGPAPAFPAEVGGLPVTLLGAEG
jgi:hypothetical protein